jgi:hypothetical protein
MSSSEMHVKVDYTASSLSQSEYKYSRTQVCTSRRQSTEFVLPPDFHKIFRRVTDPWRTSQTMPQLPAFSASELRLLLVTV